MSGSPSKEQRLELWKSTEHVGEAAYAVAHGLMRECEVGAGAGLDTGEAAKDVPPRETQPAADHVHEPAGTRRRKRSAPGDIAVENRAEDGGLDVVEAGSLRQAQRRRAELTGEVERPRELPVEHDWPTVSSEQVPRLDVLVGEHHGAWAFATLDEVGNREERLHVRGQLVGPRLAGRRRPFGKL